MRARDTRTSRSRRGRGWGVRARFRRDVPRRNTRTKFARVREKSSAHQQKTKSRRERVFFDGLQSLEGAIFTPSLVRSPSSTRASQETVARVRTASHSRFRSARRRFFLSSNVISLRRFRLGILAAAETGFINLRERFASSSAASSFESSRYGWTRRVRRSFL